MHLYLAFVIKRRGDITLPWQQNFWITTIGSLSKDDGDGNENGKKAIPYNFENKPKGLYFSKALFERLIFGGAYLRREICVSKSIRLAVQLEVNLPFLLCFTLYLRAFFQIQAPRGLIFGGTYTWRGLFSEFYGMFTLHGYHAFFCTFLSRRCTTATWNILISRPPLDGVREHETTIFFFYF